MAVPPLGRSLGTRTSQGPASRGRRILGPLVTGASPFGMSRREMLGERQVAAPLMARCAAHGALGPAHRRFQPGEGVGVHLGGLRRGGEPQRPAQGQFGQETPVLLFAFIAPAASRPGQHRAMRRQRGGQVAPCGHVSTVRQRFLRLVLRDDRGPQSIRAGAGPVTPRVAHDRQPPGRGCQRVCMPM
jgi:hypothetical protein